MKETQVHSGKCCT